MPLRDAFSVLFFVSVGMLFDPAVLVNEPLRVLTVVAIIILGKTLVAFSIVLAFRYPLNTALTVSASLAQIGEFSFILAALGVSLGLLPPEGQSLILAQAHIVRARMLVIATPDTFHARKMLETARILNPRIETVVRTHSDEEAELLVKEKVGKVFMGEHELALGMIRYVLERVAVAEKGTSGFSGVR